MTLTPVALSIVREDIHSFVDATQTPEYEYAGVVYPATAVSYFVQGSTVFDLWRDGRPDVFASLMKGYASGLDTRVAPLLFRNVGGAPTLEPAAGGGLPAIAGVRRVGVVDAPGDPVRGLFTVQHDTGDDRAADALLVEAGEIPRDATDRIDPLPLGNVLGRPTAVSAHALAAGDLNGDGRTDFAVPDWSGVVTPYFLIQRDDGTWRVREDDFLRRLVFEHPLENPGSGEGFNLLIDLHLADLDGDGLDDLVAGWGHGSARSMVYFNRGDGVFDDAHASALPLGPFGVDNSLHLKTVSRDIDGDGALDLFVLTSRYDPYYAGFAFQFLINDGAGGFTDQTASRLLSLPHEAADGRLSWSDDFHFVDVNADGHDDLIGVDDSVGVRLWLDDGTGVFTEAPVGDTPGGGFRSTGFADFDGDGRIETLGVRTSWTDAAGSATRVWFSQYEMARDLRTGPDHADTSDVAPGFNELYYLRANPLAADAVGAGVFESGLAHYLAAGRAAGLMTFAPGTIVHGGGGDDDIALREGAETAFAGAGEDTLRSGLGDDTLNGGAGRDLFAGSARAHHGDRIQDFAWGDAILVEGAAFGMDAVRRMAGGLAIDTDGDGATDVRIDVPALSAASRLRVERDDAGALIRYEAGDDGDDTVRTGAGEHDVATFSGDDRVLCGAGDDTISGGAGADTLKAGGGGDSVDGGSGDDVILAGDGDDTVDGGDGADMIKPGRGADSVDGGAGDDVVLGFRGAERLLGGDGNDTLLGGLDDDTIVGGAGDDRMQGGPGRDVFVFDDADFGHDRIVLDFRPGADRLDFGGSGLLRGDLVLTGAGGRVKIAVAGHDASIVVGADRIGPLSIGDVEDAMIF